MHPQLSSRHQQTAQRLPLQPPEGQQHLALCLRQLPVPNRQQAAHEAVCWHPVCGASRRTGQCGATGLHPASMATASRSTSQWLRCLPSPCFSMQKVQHDTSPHPASTATGSRSTSQLLRRVPSLCCCHVLGHVSLHAVSLGTFKIGSATTLAAIMCLGSSPCRQRVNGHDPDCKPDITSRAEGRSGGPHRVCSRAGGS